MSGYGTGAPDSGDDGDVRRSNTPSRNSRGSTNSAGAASQGVFSSSATSGFNPGSSATGVPLILTPSDKKQLTRTDRLAAAVLKHQAMQATRASVNSGFSHSSNDLLDVSDELENETEEEEEDNSDEETKHTATTPAAPARPTTTMTTTIGPTTTTTGGVSAPAVVTTPAPTIHTSGGAASSEVDMLRARVQELEDEKAALLAYTARCERELQQYQTQFPDIAAQIVQQGDLRAGVPISTSGAQLSALGALNPLLIAYEVRLRDANEQTKAAQTALAALKKEVTMLREQASAAVSELALVKQLAASTAANAGQPGGSTTSTPPKGSNGGPGTPDTQDLLAQLELQRQKLEILAQSEMAARQALAKLPEREALNRALQDAGRVIATQKTQLAATEAALSRSRAAVASLTRELTEAQQRLGEMETLGARYAELSQQLRQQQQAFATAEQRLLESEAQAEAASQREAAIRAELEDAQKDMQGMVAALESVDAQMRAAKQREEDLVALEAKQAQKVVELQEQCDALTVKLERSEAECAQLKKQFGIVTAELKEGCVKDVTHVYQQSKAVEEKLRADVARFEECVLASQIENEQLRRKLAMVEDHAAKISTVCEEELVRVVEELNRAQAALQVESAERGAEQSRAERLRQQVEATERMLIAVKDSGAAYTRELKTQIATLTVSLETLETRLNQAEMSANEREQALKNELARTQSQLASALEDLTREQKARVLVEEDLKQRLVEAYNAHDANASKAAELILKQESMAKKWREQQKVALRKLQTLLNEATARHESDAIRITTLEKSNAAVVQERDALAALLASEEERRAVLAQEVSDISRRLNECTRQLAMARESQERTQQEHSELMLIRDKLLSQNKKLSREVESLQRQLEQYQQHTDAADHDEHAYSTQVV